MRSSRASSPSRPTMTRRRRRRPEVQPHAQPDARRRPINTDFAQVEVDDQQVNLDRFNLFFPEKRPFFLENAGFFAVGKPGEVDLFFSRRIGIGDERRGDPDHRRRPRLGQGRHVQRRPAEHADRRLRRRRAEQELHASRASAATCPTARRSAPSSSNRAAPAICAGGRLQPHLRASTASGASAEHACVSGFCARDRDAGRRRATTTPTTCGRGPTAAAGTQRRLPGGRRRIQPRGRVPEPPRLPQGRRGPDDALPAEATSSKLQELRPHATFRGFWGLDGFQETGYVHLDNHWQFREQHEVHTGMNLTREGVRTPFEIYPGVVRAARDLRSRRSAAGVR